MYIFFMKYIFSERSNTIHLINILYYKNILTITSIYIFYYI